jgi:arginyl-tRNA synthetase
MNLEKYDLGVFLLLKSTGASLYSTKDIALAYKKQEDFPEYDKSLYVV